MNEAQTDGDADDRSWLARIMAVFSSQPKTRAALAEVLDNAHDNEVIDDDAQHIIKGAMQVADMQARDIMVPRSQMQVLKADASLADILQQIVASKHSRYPVIGESPDDVLGILLVKDLLPQMLTPDNDHFSVAALLRPRNVVPESKRLNVLLREFREDHYHMAIVIDEYGGVAGLLTIEDVLEEIVGEIEDETDLQATASIQKFEGGKYLVQALTPIADVNDALASNFSADEFDTIGGLVMQHFGYLPRHNETVTLDRFEFKVIQADQRQIHSLRVRVLDN